jgi:citrate lyase subunit beta/citryl-CoA lyase
MSKSCKIKYYVPAHDEKALLEAIESDAEAIIMDLEQNCPPDQREAGRALVQRACSEMDFKGSGKWIRVNIVGSRDLDEDLASLAHLPDGIVLAQAQNAQEVLILAEALVKVERQAGAEIGSIPIVPNIESAEGLRNAYEISANCARVMEVGLGGGDMLKDLRGLRTPEGGELFHVRARLAVEASAAKVDLVDTVTPVNATDMYLERDTREAFRLGYQGRAVLTSRHIGPIRRIWAEMTA